MKKVLLLHGWGGSDIPHWQSYLAAEIARDYGHVQFLKFSFFNFPKLEEWKKELKNALVSFEPDIVVCHSLANTLWFHLLADSDFPQVQKLYLVAPPSFSCEVPELKEFFPLKIPSKTNAKETLLIASTNDPYMSIEEVKKLQKSLNVEMKIFQEAGHINAGSGYGDWPWMLKQIQSDLN